MKPSLLIWLGLGLLGLSWLGWRRALAGACDGAVPSSNLAED